MYYIGQQFVKIPKEVKVIVDGQKVIVDGPKGRLSRILPSLVHCNHVRAESDLTSTYPKCLNTKDPARAVDLLRKLIDYQNGSERYGTKMGLEGLEKIIKRPLIFSSLPAGTYRKVKQETVFIEKNQDTKQSKEMARLCRTLVANMVTGVLEGFEKRLKIAGEDMYYVGQQFVKIPKEVKVTVNGQKIIVDGPKGRLVRILPSLVHCNHVKGKSLYPKCLDIKDPASGLNVLRKMIDYKNASKHYGTKMGLEGLEEIKRPLEYSSWPAGTYCEVKQETVFIEKNQDTKQSKEMARLCRTLVANMVMGVSAGFEKRLEITGVGYRAQLDGKNLILNVGRSQPVKMTIPRGLLIKPETPTSIVVSGTKKDKVGEFAAEIRALRPPEPYKGKGIAYEGEIIIRKAGKTGK
jgi:large subunit ribosomal protein L6